MSDYSFVIGMLIGIIVFDYIGLKLAQLTKWHDTRKAGQNTLKTPRIKSERVKL